MYTGSTELAGVWSSLVESGAVLCTLVWPITAYCRLVKPSNLSTSPIYSPTVLDLNVLGCAGLYQALVGCFGLWWAVLGSGRLYRAVL